MAPHEDEEERLRSVALQNARSILLARQRAEEAMQKQVGMAADRAFQHRRRA